MTRAIRNLWAALLLVALTCLQPQAASAAPTQQVIHIRASDGRDVPAMVNYPEGGPDTNAPVAIIHHGGPGGHPLRALSAARWAADYFAKRGYITISIVSRISRDVIDQPFGAGAADIKGAVDWASQLSSGPIVLVGHSSGSISSTYYEATTQDPRIKAIVHFAPTFPGNPWMTTNMGQQRYDAVVARLRKLVAQGKGDMPTYEDHRLAPPAPQNITYGYLMSASTWLSWWGPESKQNNRVLFGKIRVPMLMVSGDADIFVSRAYHDELRKAAVNSPRVDAVMLEGGVGHEFAGSEAKAAGIAFDWLNQIGIHPQPRVATRVVDLNTGGFGANPGVIYEPMDKASRKPMAVMLMPDFGDDVLVTPFEKIGTELARAGYTVLVPQDRGGGWAFYRAEASGLISDRQAWLKYLGEQGFANTAVIAHGWSGALVPPVLGNSPVPKVAGVALIQPPQGLAKFASDALGPDGYAKAVAEADAAIASGKGGTTMVIAPYRTTGRKPEGRKWINQMAKGFLSLYGPQAPAAPIPALQAAGKPLLLVDAGTGRFMPRDAETALASKPGTTGQWYDGVTSPFDAPERLTQDLTAWLDSLAAKPKQKP